MSKSELAEYCAKEGLPAPIYNHKKRGPPHSPSFQASVKVKRTNYTSPVEFPHLKEAEHAVAAMALEILVNKASYAMEDSGESKNSLQEFASYAMEDSGESKSSLQEFAQQNKFPLPTYYMAQTGKPHAPIFTCVVEVGEALYKGMPSKQKKLAENSAASIALWNLNCRRKIEVASPLGDCQCPQYFTKGIDS